MRPANLLMRRSCLDNLPQMPALPDGFSLHVCEEREIPSLAALLSAAFEDANWNVEKVREALIDAADVKTTHVITYEGQVIATASSRLLPEAYPGSGYLHWVASHPNYRGQRLGYIISLVVLHEFAELGCQDAVLETQDPRIPAIKTYFHLDFEPEYRDDAARWEAIRSQIVSR